MNDEKVVNIINKRNRAVFGVPLEEARELLDNFKDFVETDEELPVEPKVEPVVSIEEKQILGISEEEHKTDEELPVEPKVEPVVSKPVNANNQPKKVEIAKN